MATDSKLAFRPFGSGFEIADDGANYVVRFPKDKTGAQPSASGKMHLTAKTGRFLPVDGDNAPNDGLRANFTVAFYPPR
jgi:hypothetical protein